jgi:hypothetical protein
LSRRRWRSRLYSYRLGVALGSAIRLDFRQHIADADGVALIFDDARQDAGLLGRHLDVDLIGLQLNQRLTRRYGITLVLEPLADRRIDD